MLNESFLIDGVDVKTLGIYLQNHLEFEEAEPIIDVESVDGRNGDLIKYTGSYNNRSMTAECFVLQKDVARALSKINLFLLGKQGYRRIESTDDPDHFWMGCIQNGATIAQRIRLLAPFEIEFDCMPQRFLKAGEMPIEMVTPGIIENPAFPSRPIIMVYGDGNAKLNVGNYIVEFLDIDGMTVLDSEEQDAYNDKGSMNAYIKADEFPVLEMGQNEISWAGGIQRIEIVPRWWDL